MHPHVVHAVVLLHPHVLRLAARLARAACAAVAGRLPKISVITPTWQRRGVLTGRCIPSVAAQTYAGEIEHVIVSDGPDPALDGVPGVTFLDAHRPEPNRGLRARLHGTTLATGDLIAYLDDDNAWRPPHLEWLAAAVAARGADFAYSQAQCRNEHGISWVIGCSRPAYGQIDTSLIVHRAGLLGTATWQPSTRPADWDLVDRWLAAGASWAHVPAITLDYYAHGPARAVPVRP